MATIGPGLRKRLQTAASHESFEVNIFLVRDPADSLDAADSAGMSHEEILGSLRGAGSEARRNLIGLLQAEAAETAALDDPTALPPRNIQSFWISNAVGVEVGRRTLDALRERDDIDYIDINRHAVLEDLLDGPAGLVEATVRPTAEGTAPEPTWSVKRVGAPLLWAKGLTGRNVTVAVIDTGVNYRHPDLAGNMWKGGAEFPNHGFDFASNDNDPRDDHGHGTACAGIVAGTGTSGTATGVAPGATIMAIRVGVEERLFWRGMQFAIEQKADVISMSMTWKFDKSPDYPGWRRVCEAILAAGIPHANSGGNQGHDLIGFPVPFNIGAPGNCPPPRRTIATGGVSSPITCGNTDDLDQLDATSGRGPCGWDDAPFSDYPFDNGNKPGLLKPDVCAPGRGAISCSHRFPDDPTAKPYREFGGTSAATPHVAGCLALLVQACKDKGTRVIPALLQEALEETAVKIGTQNERKEVHVGAGRVDVFAAWSYGRQRNWW